MRHAGQLKLIESPQTFQLKESKDWLKQPQPLEGEGGNPGKDKAGSKFSVLTPTSLPVPESHVWGRQHTAVLRIESCWDWSSCSKECAAYVQLRQLPAETKIAKFSEESNRMRSFHSIALTVSSTQSRLTQHRKILQRKADDWRRLATQ